VCLESLRQYGSVRSRNSRKVKVLRNTYGSGWIANGRIPATMRR
jgi:hypothetical protein